MMPGGSWPFTGGPIERSGRLKLGKGRGEPGANPVFAHNIFFKIFKDKEANCDQYWVLFAWILLDLIIPYYRKL